MTIPAWPLELPRPNRSGWSAQMQDGRQHRATSGGPPGYRRRFSSSARLVGLEIDVSRREKGVFDKFFIEQTASGTTPFTMPDPTTDGWALLDESGHPLLDGDGSPILTSAIWLCLFGEAMPVEVIVVGLRFRIAFSVAVMP